jgi:hypothetical protein
MPEDVFASLRQAAAKATAAGALPSFLGELERVRTEALLTASLPPVLPAPEDATAALGVREAAAMFGEPVETFRRRLEYRKALLTRPGERRLRYSRHELERIRRDRLAGNVGA